MHEGWDVSKLEEVLAMFRMLESPNMINKIKNSIDKISNFSGKKQMSELEKLQNMQNKYIFERRTNLIVHDPETGLPKLVSTILLILIERRTYEISG